MSRNNYHSAMVEWLLTCPQIEDLFFNFSNAENGDTVLAPVNSSEWVEGMPYIDGSGRRIYDFSIVQYSQSSIIPNSDENADTLFDVEAVMDWIDEQNEVGNFPDFGLKCRIEKVENLQNMPSVAVRDETGAKYMFSCRITYFYEP